MLDRTLPLGAWGIARRLSNCVARCLRVAARHGFQPRVPSSRQRVAIHMNRDSLSLETSGKGGPTLADTVIESPKFRNGLRLMLGTAAGQELALEDQPAWSCPHCGIDKGVHAVQCDVYTSDLIEPQEGAGTVDVLQARWTEEPATANYYECAACLATLHSWDLSLAN